MHPLNFCADARVKIPRSEPLAVQQWDGLIAINYPARSKGLGRLNTASAGRAQCPELHVRFVTKHRGDVDRLKAFSERDAVLLSYSLPTSKLLMKKVT